jgi:hypothetical protein
VLLLGRKVTETKTYSVPGVHCSHCKDAVTHEVDAVERVQSVDVDPRGMSRHGRRKQREERAV